MRTEVVRHTLRASVHNELGYHAKKKELYQTNGEPEAGPVVTVLHHLQTVALEIDVTIKVHFMKRLHGDLVRSTVFGPIRIFLEIEVEFDRAAGELGLLIAARANRRNDEPPSCQKREINNQGEEDESLQAAADFPFQIVWNSKQNRYEDFVVERVGTGSFGGKGGILDRRVLKGTKVRTELQS